MSAKFWWAVRNITLGTGGNTGGGQGGGVENGSLDVEIDCAGDPYGNDANPGPYPQLEFLVNGSVVYGPVDVTADRNGSPSSQTLEFSIPYRRGAVVTVGVRFSNDWGASPYNVDTDRNLIVTEVRITDPGVTAIALAPEDGTFVLTTPRTGGQASVAADGIMFENGTLTWTDAGELLGNGSLEIVVSGRPTTGDSTNSGPEPRAQWLVNGAVVGSPVTITAVTGTDTQTLTLTASGTVEMFGLEYVNYYNAGGSIGPREMTIHSGKISDQNLAIDSSFTRTIFNSPADFVDTGNGLLWKNGTGVWNVAAATGGSGGSGGGGSNSGGGTSTSGDGAIRRAGNKLLFNGNPDLRLFGPNFNPWGSTAMNGTWLQSHQDRSVAELTRVKSVWDANAVRILVAPGVYEYWNGLGRFWPWMHALMAKCAELQLFVIIDWWTVAQPGGGKADDSWKPAYLPFFYSTSVAAADAFWLKAAQELKQYPWAIFHLWDEPWGSWDSIQPYVQQWIYTIRNQGAKNVISLPGGNYNRDFRGIGLKPVLDTLDPPQFTIGSNEFQSEPQNYLLFHTDATLGNLDLLYPVLLGGFGWPPDDGSAGTPTGAGAADMQTWLSTWPAAAEGIHPWSHDIYSTPRAGRIDLGGWPASDVTLTLTNLGAAMKALRPSTLIYNTGSTTSPPPPPAGVSGQPAPIAAIPSVVDLTGQANVYFDPSAGSNGNGSLGSPFNNLASSLAALQPGQKWAQKRGTVYNGDGNSEFAVDIVGKAGCTFGCYGASGARPIWKNSKFFNSGITSASGGASKVAVGTMPATTGYAATSVTHATACIVDGTKWNYWRARNGATEVTINASFDMLYHTSGDMTFRGTGSSPTTVEVPWRTTARVRNSDGIIIQDLDIGHSRDHGLIMGEVGGSTIRRCLIRNCGLSGIYWQNKRNEITYDVIVEDCEFFQIHAEGLVLNWPANVRNAFRRTKVRRNKFHKCCMGPPFIFSGTTSQDYYSAAFKIFTQCWEPATWWNDIECYDNHIHDIGDIGIAYVYDGNYKYSSVNGYESNQAMGVWPDTVTGHPTLGGVRIYNNLIEDLWAAGVFIENCPDGGHLVDQNLIINAGTDLTSWTGGACIGRGSRGHKVEKNTFRSCRFGGVVFQGTDGNTVTGPGVSWSQGVQNNQIRNNIFSQTNNYPCVTDRARDGGSSNSFTNNLFHGGGFRYHPNQPWANPTSYASVQAYANARGGGLTGSIEADPKFTNAGADDFSLQSDSPAKNAATDGGNIGAV